MGKRGRKPVHLPNLIFWEWHWWRAFSLMRDGMRGGKEIDGGWFPPGDCEPPMRPAWMTHPGAIHDWERQAGKEYFSRFEQKFYRSAGVPAERHLWEALKRAQTARQVRRICSQSVWRSRLSHLYERAEEFLCALKNDSRYPRMAITKDDGRILHCARVMAGISCRIPPATAVDKLRKLKHGKVRSCNCSGCTNIKMEFVQWILSDFSDARVSLPAGALAKLDEPCNCTHCSLMAWVDRRRRETDGGSKGPGSSWL